MKSETKSNRTCNICSKNFKHSLLLPFRNTCAKCSESEPVQNFVYDEDAEMEIYRTKNPGGRTAAVFLDGGY